MSKALLQHVQQKPGLHAAPSFTPVRSGLLQRKCACGGTLGPTGECEACKKKRLGFQTKLKVNEPGDSYEQEVDRIADQVMAAPAHAPVSGTPPPIQRFSGQSSGQMSVAPASVDHALSGPGRPLEPALRRDMEQRFGYDFSQVRVHADARAAESAESVHALAYTVGQDIVFGRDHFAPSTHHGRELLGHELAHTIQQRSLPGASPSPASSALESNAETAGHAVAAGQLVSPNFPAGGVGLARQVATPTVFDDQELARAIQVTSERLKQPSYPGRAGDVDWMTQLQAEAARRAKLKPAPAVTPPKPATPPKPPPRDPAAERAVAVAEAEAAAAQIDQDQKTEDEDDEPAVTPMAIAGQKYEAKPAAKVAAKRPRRKAPDPALAKFLPGGFTDEDIYKESNEAMKRIDDQIAKDREISKTPYEKRLQSVRIKLQKKMDIELSRNEAFSRMTGDEVWNEGINDGLFIESEKQAVYEDQNSLQQYIQEKMEEDRKHARAKFESDQYQAWVAKGEQLSSPETIIQPFVVAAAAPELVAAAYFGTQTGAMVGDMVNACKNGVTADCAEATAKVVAAVAAERALKGKSGESPKPEGGGAPPENPDLTFPRGTDVTNRSAFPRPTPVTDAEVVASNAKNPASIKPQEAQAHQQNWRDLGGQGKAPTAYRDPDGNIRISKDSVLLKPATRAGIPPVQPGASKPVPKPATPVPAPAAKPASNPVGTANTGKAPAPPDVDPMAKTPAAPAPPAKDPTPKVSPKGGTVEEKSQPPLPQQQAGRQIDPPQAISEEAVQKLQNQPRPSPPGKKGRGGGVGYTVDHDHHQLAWQRLGGHGAAPPAFIYDGQVYLDPSRWPPKH